MRIGCRSGGVFPCQVTSPVNLAVDRMKQVLVEHDQVAGIGFHEIRRDIGALHAKEVRRFYGMNLLKRHEFFMKRGAM